jgi:hypothetical protein
MAKWADFLIVRVKCNREHTHIVEVEVVPDLGDSTGTARKMSRQDVVLSILRGTTFVTAYLRDSKWQKGEDVRVVTINGERYIRTDNNSVRADNLGNLPEYT